MMVLAIALGVLRSRVRFRKKVENAHAPHRAAFEQSLNGALMVDADSLKVVDANTAFQRGLAYPREEAAALPVANLFTEGGGYPELLAPKLRDPNPRLPLEIQQRAKDGT